MTLVRWNTPFTPTAVDELFNNFWRGLESNAEDKPTVFAPRVDIVEREDAVVVTAELPGIKKDDVHIAVDEGVLEISAEHKIVRDVKKETYHRVERRTGKFLRRFTLGDNVDPEKIDAKMTDGVLEITLPKKEEAKPKKIEVKVS
ncbi:MAG: Hsp20/alpha crystallin family protein [Deltaproteobacteria bacterium]|nr:Hsp20/alpha crystallin family protein [Deltaproteobacteria bacterium]